MDKKGLEEDIRARRVKRNILTYMIVIPLIPLFLAVGISFYYFTTALENSSTHSLKRIVGDHRDMIESFLLERKSDLELVTNLFDFESISRNQVIDDMFEILKIKSGAFIDLGLFDSRGLHVRYSGQYQLTGKLYKDEFWFREVMEKGRYISDVFLGYRNVPHFIIAVKKGEGEDAWILRATIDTLFFDRLVSGVRIGRSGEAYILNNNGIAQTGRRSGGVNVMEEDPEFSAFPSSDSIIHTFLKSDPQGTKYLYATTWLKDLEWLLVVRQEKKDAFRFFYYALYASLVIVVLGIAIIVGMSVFMTEKLFTRIEQLGRDKKDLGNQLIRATQLAEVGEMAAGFAHEINNPLQIIKSEHALMASIFEDLSENKKIDPKDEEILELEDSLSQIALQVSRCSDITRAILKFGRKNETRVQLLYPGEQIPEILKMIEQRASVEGIAVFQNIPEDLPGFMGDASQFQQVMLNLFNNAIDAIMERHPDAGGRLDIQAFLKNEKWIEIRVTDNGAGIHPEHIEKVFSPFFTTKPVGKGTGLGLSVCYGIIESFSGTMDVTSRVNDGTTFIITLPMAESEKQDD
ncbi:sensor histidine kinase [Desulfotignum balticum]|uniref:sensor histidine kinase n=1 Tax=Desulfotignum balticum TaxID=115781 RepID=UPI000408E444|nr:sensor histidine kinase [Desulfotignum balticum]